MFSRLLVVVLFLCCVEGQIVELDRRAVPPSDTLHLLYAFYVYSHKEAPSKEFGDSFVRFHAVEVNGAKSDTDGVYLSLVRYDDWDKVVDSTHFCCTKWDAAADVCPVEHSFIVQKSSEQSFEDIGVLVHQVPGKGDSTNDIRMRLVQTGVYVLVLSNCGGDVPGGYLSGKVSVKNPYGFLAGNEFYKLRFSGWLSVSYLILAFVWLSLSLRWWKESLHIHGCIAGVILLGLVQCFMRFAFFSNLNSDGVPNYVLFSLALVFTVSKSVFSYMLVLVASLGWGVTLPFLEPKWIRRVEVVSAAYIVLGVLKELALSNRHPLSLPLPFTLLIVVPAAGLNVLIFVWIFNALTTLMDKLKERGQTDKFKLFYRLWAVLSLAIVVACVSWTWLVVDLSRDVLDGWKHQWALTEGTEEIVFLFVLTSIVYLWAPNKHSQRYAYNVQVDAEGSDEEKPKPTNSSRWSCQADVDEGEDFWRSKSNFERDSSDAAWAGEADGDVEDDFWATTRKDAEEDHLVETIGSSYEETDPTTAAADAAILARLEVEETSMER